MNSQTTRSIIQYGLIDLAVDRTSSEESRDSGRTEIEFRQSRSSSDFFLSVGVVCAPYGGVVMLAAL